MAKKPDWSKIGIDKVEAARRLYEAGAPIYAISSTTGLTESAIKRHAENYQWAVPEELRDAFAEATEAAVAVKAEKNREETALLITDAEAERLLDQLGARNLTLPERANQYSAIMARVAMRVAVMHLKMTSQELLDNASKLGQLDIIARRALNIGPSSGDPASKSDSKTVVNVMASAGLPPALSGEAGVRLQQERLVFSTPGALPPVIPAKE